MKQCPKCGEKFSWWASAVGEYKEHVRKCCVAQSSEDAYFLASVCRGCPANCYEKFSGENDNASDAEEACHQ